MALDSPRARVAIVLACLVGIAGLCVWFGTLGPVPELGAYPTEDQFLDRPDAYLGERVVTHGWIVGADPVVIEVESEAGETVALRVTDVGESVTVGDNLRVYGTLVDARTIRSEGSFTVPPWGTWYTYGVSFLAGLWVLARILRHWRFDRDALGLAPDDGRPDEVGDR